MGLRVWRKGRFPFSPSSARVRRTALILQCWFRVGHPKASYPDPRTRSSSPELEISAPPALSKSAGKGESRPLANLRDFLESQFMQRRMELRGAWTLRSHHTTTARM